MSRQTNTRSRLAASAASLTAAAEPAPVIAEEFRKLGGLQIGRALSCIEFTDEVHWACVFAAGGKLTSVGMGKRGTGTWRVAQDQLCLVRPAEQEHHYEVWQPRDSISWRAPGFDLAEHGIPKRPSQQN
jgi:hypothetical protein